MAEAKAAADRRRYTFRREMPIFEAEIETESPMLVASLEEQKDVARAARKAGGYLALARQLAARRREERLKAELSE